MWMKHNCVNFFHCFPSSRAPCPPALRSTLSTQLSASAKEGRFHEMRGISFQLAPLQWKSSMWEAAFRAGEAMTCGHLQVMSLECESRYVTLESESFYSFPISRPASLPRCALLRSLTRTPRRKKWKPKTRLTLTPFHRTLHFKLVCRERQRGDRCCGLGTELVHWANSGANFSLVIMFGKEVFFGGARCFICLVFFDCQRFILFLTD